MRSLFPVLLLCAGPLCASTIQGPTGNYTVDHLLYLSPVTTDTDQYNTSDLDDKLAQEFPEFDFVLNPQNTLVGFWDPHDPYKNIIWAPPRGDDWPGAEYDGGDGGHDGGGGKNGSPSGPWHPDSPTNPTPAVPEPADWPVAAAGLAAIPGLRAWRSRRGQFPE